MASEVPRRAPAPAIVVVDGGEDDLAYASAALTSRYAADYEIVAEKSAAAAIERLARLRDEGRSVAIVLADRHLLDGSGIEFLARVRDYHPDAKRGVLVSWGAAWGGDPSATDDIVRAAALGQVDNFVLKPVTVPDERFHLAIAEFLDDWGRRHLPQFEVIRIVGDRWSEYSHAIRDALERNSIPFGFYEPESPDGRALLDQVGAAGPLPIVILHDGRFFAQPSANDIAGALGLNVRTEESGFDVIVLGAGPAGLAAAVYSASEGLRVLVVEPEAIGGQAGTSSLIRNYLGFPRGLSGADLAVRAYQQAWFFGTKFLIGRTATGLRAENGDRIVTLDDGTEVRSRAVVLAVGVSYVRMGIASVDGLIGRGVFYGAATTEASAMKGEEVFVVGGANSAGQAAIYLARFAARVTILVRGSSLSAGMSDYLIRDIETLPNMAVRLNTEVVEARGEGRLRSVVVRDRVSGSLEELPAAAIFVLIGAVPRTAWLPDAVRRDGRGFILTGTALATPGSSADGDIAPLATSLAGVFAVGDVRADSTKRVASAVGEGSVSVRYIHDYLARSREGAGHV